MPMHLLRFGKKSRLIFLFISISLGACERYTTVNDHIYAVPTEDNLNASVSLQALADAIEENPQNPEAYYKRALIRFKQTEDSLALSDIEKAIALDDINPDYNYAYAQIQYRLGDYEAARQAILKAQRPGKNDLEMDILVGKIHYELREYDVAIRYLNRALKIDSQNPLIYLLKGKVSFNRLDSTLALRYYRQAIDIQPKYPEVFDGFSELYLKFQMYDTAIAYANKGLILSPRDPSLNVHKAQAFIGKRFYRDSAYVYFLHALEADSTLDQAAFQIGKYFYENGQCEEASPYLEQALVHNPEIADANVYLGICYRQEGRREDALLKFDAATRLDPQNLIAKEAYWAIKRQLEREKELARQDSIQKAYYKQLLEEQKKREEELRKQWEEQRKAWEEQQRKWQEQQNNPKK